MEDLLLILLGLVWLGLTFYRNSQKKKRQEIQPDEYEEEDTDAGSLLEELLGEKRYREEFDFEEEEEEPVIPEAPAADPFMREVKISEPKIVSLEKIESLEYEGSLEDLEEDDGDLTKSGSVFDEDAYDISEEEEPENGSREFDLRQAVIYSEILKRPQF